MTLLRQLVSSSHSPSLQHCTPAPAASRRVPSLPSTLPSANSSSKIPHALQGSA
ncbi:hypothetical protein SCHPADRAFT_911979 [Schizopora paradoxa]|uniref:Uncharacterized protein n=1 Tax=Schizopora paradoxa TaxID=27342 RepID=A0A0H2QWU0_9AGAM|nr:hypothetical protein SCHPADRAFT_911979 [Schizopora paradoxa]